MEKKLPEIVIAPNVVLNDTFVGVRANGDGTFSDFRFSMQDIVAAVLGSNFLGAPTLSTPPVQNGQTTLTGTDVAGANYYEIQVSVSPSFIGASTVQTVAWPKVIAGLTNGVKYYFRSRSKNDSVVSPWSNIVSVTPSATASTGFPFIFPFILQ